MKHLIASFLLAAPALGLVLPLSAQATPATAKKPAAKVTAKAPAKKAAAKKPVAKKTTAAKTAGVAAGAGAAAAAALALQPLDADALAIAQRVHTGRIGCELGQHVNVHADEQNPGYFKVSGSGFNFHMNPVATSTGAVRLEDSRAGAVWLQIANKSMLMNQKVGKRLADECMSPEQMQVAEAIRLNPPKSLLEGIGGQ